MNAYAFIGYMFIFMMCFIGYAVGTRFGWDAGVATAFAIYLLMPPTPPRNR